jgi:hypothetical protein
MVMVMDVIGMKKTTSQAAPTMVGDTEAIWVWQMIIAATVLGLL